MVIQGALLTFVKDFLEARPGSLFQRWLGESGELVRRTGAEVLLKKKETLLGLVCAGWRQSGVQGSLHLSTVGLRIMFSSIPLTYSKMLRFNERILPKAIWTGRLGSVRVM